VTWYAPINSAPFPPPKPIRALNEATMVLIMIESAEALAEVDAIAAVEGVDVLFIGTNDLSVPRWASLASSTMTRFEAPMPKRWTHAGSMESIWVSAG
jgi:citrate lyase beta subunit